MMPPVIDRLRQVAATIGAPSPNGLAMLFDSRYPGIGWRLVEVPGGQVCVTVLVATRAL